MKAYTHRVVYHDASRYAACGYFVLGESVYCESADAAQKLARRVCRFHGAEDSDPIAVRTEDGTYWYTSQEHADADQDGTAAECIVYPLDDEDQDKLRERYEGGAS